MRGRRRRKEEDARDPEVVFGRGDQEPLGAGDLALERFYLGGSSVDVEVAVGKRCRVASLALLTHRTCVHIIRV